MTAVDKPEFWRSIRPGSSISLTDRLAIEDSMERDEGVKGRDYVIERIRDIHQDENFAQWLMFKLDNPDQELWLMAKIVDQHVKLLVYYEPEEFHPGDRKDLLNRGDYWLFDEPDNPDDFFPDELNYTNEIVWTIEIDTVDHDVAYRMKGQRVLYGLSTHRPKMEGLEGAMTAVVEYTTKDDKKNPELLILEMGGETGNRGGFITAMFGIEIGFSEIEVLNLLQEPPAKDKKPPLWSKIIKKVTK